MRGTIYSAERIEGMEVSGASYLSCCRAIVFWIFDVLEAIVMSTFAILYK